MAYPLCPSGTCETDLIGTVNPGTNPRPCIATTKPFHMLFWSTFRVWLGLWPIELSLLCLNVSTERV